MIETYLKEAESNIRDLDVKYPSGTVILTPNIDNKILTNLYFIDFNHMYSHLIVQMYDNKLLPNRFYDVERLNNDINKIKDFLSNQQEYKQNLSTQDYIDLRTYVNKFFSTLYYQHRPSAILLTEYVKEFYKQLTDKHTYSPIRAYNDPNIIYIDTDMIILKDITPSIKTMIDSLNIPYDIHNIPYYYIKRKKQYVYLTDTNEIKHKGLQTRNNPNGHNELVSIMKQYKRNNILEELFES